MARGRRHAVIAAGIGLLAGLVVGPGAVPASRADEPGSGPVSLEPPTVSGRPTFGHTLQAHAGTWDPEDVTLTYRWLRDGDPIGRAERTRELGLRDLGHRLSVRVRATDAQGARSTVVSAPTPRVRKATLTNRQRPTITGERRFGSVLRATPGRWSSAPDVLRYRWWRDGSPVRGARGQTYRIAPGDVGHRVKVSVRAEKAGYTYRRASSPPTAALAHRRDVHRAVTYHVETRGKTVASLALFKRLAQQTYADARGWRGAGVSFRRVARGGSFTLVLATPDQVPVFSSGCSAQWSCRVGRYVIINQARWLHATPAWNAAHGSLRDYRHMVVNHETGHWLGFGHAGCPGAGKAAPVMMQQSKSLGGCHFNPFPTLAEQARAS